MDELIIPILNIANSIIREILEDDDEIDERTERNSLEKTEHFAEFTVPNFNDRQFQEHFRMMPTTFEVLLGRLHEITEQLHNIHRGMSEIPLEKQTLMTLWCLSNLESFRSVADRFGVSKSCCWQVLKRTCLRLLVVNRRWRIISFPSGQRALDIMHRIEERTGFPNVIGIIDGCHIRIQKPREFPNSYINRKGFPSVLLQGICDDSKLFIDVYAGEPGSIHDARLLEKSDIHQRMRQNEVHFPEDSHLLGDLAYPLSTRIMVGFKDNGQLTRPQRFFNYKLSQTRCVIENAFALLKGRFRRLKMMETKRLDLVALLVVSACILHNLCILNNDLYEGIVEPEAGNLEANVDAPAIQPPYEAIAKRNNIMHHIYRRFHEYQ